MIDVNRIWTSAKSEDGGSAVLLVGILGIAVLVSAIALDVGNWYEHRRHLQLQTDAAALAGGQLFRSCATPGADGATVLTNMESVATQYGGDTGRLASAYNKQVGSGAAAGNVMNFGYQSSTYPPNDTPVADTNPCTSGVFDVRATEDAIPHFLKFPPILTTVRAHSRVEMKAINQLKGLLPLAVPDVRPSFVFATFIDERTGAPITGCPASCTEQLTKGATVNNEQTWIPIAGTEISVPIVKDIGVRIRLVGANNPSLACGQLYTECYDAASAKGVVHVRGWTSGSGAVARDVWLLTGTCAPDAYFTTTDTCSAGLQADVDVGATVGPNTQVWASVDGAKNPKYQLTPAQRGVSGVVRWTLNSGITITGDGPHTIELNYNTGSGGDQSFGTVQRSYDAYPSGSGPLDLVQVYEANVSSSGANSFKVGETHALGVTIKTIGNLLLSQPTDAPIFLRVFNDSGSASQNQTLDCDKDLSNLESELAAGCDPFFIKNPSLTCPGGNANNLWNIWYVNHDPLPCVLVQTGASPGQISRGLNERIFGDPNPPQTPGECSLHPINWIRNQGFEEDAHADDTRALPLIVTPLGSFTGRGGDQVPVIDFAYFYVTGYRNDPCAGNDANEDPVPTNRGAYVRGHFIKFFPLEHVIASDDKCDLTSITPCLSVLTR